MSATNTSNDFCVALLALKTGWLDIAGSLPQAANGCFVAVISVRLAPDFGRVLPVPARRQSYCHRPLFSAHLSFAVPMTGDAPETDRWSQAVPKAVVDP